MSSALLSIALAFASPDGGDLQLVVETATSSRLELSWANLTTTSSQSSKIHRFTPLAAPRQNPLSFKLQIENESFVFQVPPLHSKELRVLIRKSDRQMQGRAIEGLVRQNAGKFDPNFVVRFDSDSGVHLLICPKLISGELGENFSLGGLSVLSALEPVIEQRERILGRSHYVQLKSASFIFVDTSSPVVYPSIGWGFLEDVAKKMRKNSPAFIFLSANTGGNLQQMGSGTWAAFRGLMYEQNVTAVFMGAVAKEIRYQRGFFEDVAYVASSDGKPLTPSSKDEALKASDRYLESSMFNWLELNIGTHESKLQVRALEGGLIDELSLNGKIERVVREKRSDSIWSWLAAMAWCLFVAGAWFSLIRSGPYRRSS